MPDQQFRRIRKIAATQPRRLDQLPVIVGCRVSETSPGHFSNVTMGHCFRIRNPVASSDKQLGPLPK